MKSIEKKVVKAFRARWMTLRDQVQSGNFQPPHQMFEARKEEDRKELAQAYYSKEHIETMCALSDEQIADNLAPVCRYLAKTGGGVALAKELLAGEYIKFRTNETYESGDIDLGYKRDEFTDEWRREVEAGVSENMPDWDVNRYPSTEPVYDDWFESVGGSGALVSQILIKSTGEAFTGREVRLIAESVVDNLMSCGLSEGNGILFECAFSSDYSNQLLITVQDDAEEYRESLLTPISMLKRDTVEKIVKKTLLKSPESQIDLPITFISLVKSYANGKIDYAGFKKKLEKIVKRQSPREILSVERIIGNFLFGSRPYYHGTSENIEFFDDFE